MGARVLIAVTHLLGSGHLVRARHLARALADAGHRVTLASGGMPLRGEPGEAFAYVQLPPVRVEGVDFRNLLDEAGQPIDAAFRARRKALLLALATRLAPDVVITEHFPFGRRQLADEFMGMIVAAKAANPAALVLASIRDVLVAPRTDRIAEAHARIEADFDGVLVHGDAAFLPLEASWPVSPDLAGRLHYTGYLTAPPPISHNPHPEEAAQAASLQDEGSSGKSEILVSGGGSAAALPLFRLCLEASRLAGPARPWRILFGRGTSEAAFADLKAAAPGHVTVEWSRPDFPALLSACALSISQAGYNTVLDLVAAQRPALVVPFDDGNETEQAIRAQAMERAGLARSLRMSGPDALTASHLAEAAASALREGPSPLLEIDRNGAARTAAILTGLLAKRRRPMT